MSVVLRGFLYCSENETHELQHFTGKSNKDVFLFPQKHSFGCMDTEHMHEGTPPMGNTTFHRQRTLGKGTQKEEFGVCAHVISVLLCWCLGCVCLCSCIFHTRKPNTFGTHLETGLKHLHMTHTFEMRMSLEGYTAQTTTHGQNTHTHAQNSSMDTNSQSFEISTKNQRT